jgi:hypothetical protein
VPAVARLVALAVWILEDHRDEPLQQLVSRAGARGVVGDFKNLIFAADGPKPELVTGVCPDARPSNNRLGGRGHAH